ncbi:MAG: glycoside hydrolase 43 family protein [Treponema sp.]|nr:glycoside hydrolase 43 family protein [Treponema sp.]
MMYKNPILLCDYSDPDVCRVGNDFYLTASSFNFVPGLPILHSTDLLHWKLINYAAPSIPFPEYNCVQNAKGIWAPSIRFHDGRFFIFFAMPDEGIFCTTAQSPYESWSDWICVREGKGFIDPCPLWDDDGTLYLVHAYAKSRLGFNSKLGLLKLDPVSLKSVSEDTFIFDGTQTQPTIEGPKFYKRNGFYYIFAPAGGVSTGWQTVLRSKKIDGPYEEKIVLEKNDSPVNGPHQGAWIHTEQDEDWFIHFQDAGIFGRITHLQPMKWKDDWPVIGKNGTPVTKWKKPALPYIAQRKFPAPSEFQSSANVTASSFAHAKTPLWLTPSVCTKKIDSLRFSYKKSFSFKDSWHENERRGIIFLGNDYAALQIEKSAESEFTVSYIESYGRERGDDERKEKVIWSRKITLASAHTHQEVLPECAGGANFSLLESKKSDNSEKITFALKFKAHPDKKSGTVQFFLKAKLKNERISFTSHPFATENAHWVGGRFGYF